MPNMKSFLLVLLALFTLSACDDNFSSPAKSDSTVNKQHNTAPSYFNPAPKGSKQANNSLYKSSKKSCKSSSFRKRR